MKISLEIFPVSRRCGEKLEVLYPVYNVERELSKAQTSEMLFKRSF